VGGEADAGAAPICRYREEAGRTCRKAARPKREVGAGGEAALPPSAEAAVSGGGGGKEGFRKGGGGGEPIGGAPIARAK